ncbi:MAG: hypothetical protein ACYC5G_02185 [Candidatus Doudnabacteria bacterium]
MSKVVHYGVDGKTPCNKIGDLDYTDSITEVTCKRCLKRLNNNPKDPFNKKSKRCICCEKILSLDEFWENKNELDGKCNKCIKCIRIEKGTYSEPEIFPEGYKKCSLCGEVKEFCKFSPRKDGNIGLMSRCRKCSNETNRPKKIHLMVCDKSFCGDIDAVKFSENINEVDCKKCNRIYYDEIEFSVKDAKKKCRNCEQIKDVDKFLNNSQCKDGKNNWCRECSHGPYKENEEFDDGYKRCSKCNKLKELDEFSNSQIGTLGKSSSCKECQKQLREENKDIILEKQREYYLDNKQRVNNRNNKNYQKNKDVISDKLKIDRKNNPEKYRIKSRKHNELIAKYSTYASRLTIEEEPIEGENGELLCRCTFCKEYFKVKNLYAKNRACSIEGKESSENRLYCSDDCKGKCAIFGQKKYPKDFKRNSRCNQKRVKEILIQMQIDEEGFTYCDKCGKSFSQEDLYFHHNLPVGDEPNEYDNAAHYMLVCEEHHTHKGCLGNKYD